MKGGYQILDLRNIGISYSSETKNITDPEILNQLRNLREYIEKGHDYSSALNNSLKCVMIRYRDAKVNEKQEVCEFAEIISTNSSLTYEIKGKELSIEVVFEEKQDDDGNPYYDIKTAKYLYNQNVTIGGDLNVGGDATLDGDLDVTGESTFSDDVQFEKDVSITGNMTVGANSNIKIFENIVDKDGHKRFIEGVVERTNNTPEGMTFSYAKWSLSGSHLMIVIAGTIADTVVVPNSAIAEVTLPAWIFSKIIPVWIEWIDQRTVVLRNPDFSIQNMSLFAQKMTNNKLNFVAGSVTLDKERTFRYQLDLLIDNE